MVFMDCQCPCVHLTIRGEVVNSRIRFPWLTIWDSDEAGHQAIRKPIDMAGSFGAGRTSQFLRFRGGNVTRLQTTYRDRGDDSME